MVAGDLRERKSENVPKTPSLGYNLILEVISHHFRYAAFVKTE
jgi:hypothetical protein